MTDTSTSSKKPRIPKWQQMDHHIKAGSLLLLFATIIGAFTYWRITTARIAVEKGEIAAPIIHLSARTGGTLETLWVAEGDPVTKNQPVAQIGDEIVRSREDGLIVLVHDEIGKNFAPNEAVVDLIRPEALRVNGTVSENKGLRDIHVGQRATFTVDAFGSKTYKGIVDAVAPSAKTKGLAFSISDKRTVNDFVIKIRFDVASYPELKNGMSAKITVYK